MNVQRLIVSILLIVLVVALCPSAACVGAIPSSALASGTLEQVAAEAQALSPGASADDLESASWWSIVQENIRQSEYHITWQERTYLSDLPAAYQAPNRAHALRTYFAPGGIRVIPRADAAPAWEWGLALIGCGYAGEIQPVAAARLAASANRIAYRRGTLTEWYVNDERGLEQGFTLTVPPAGSHRGVPLHIEMALSGDLSPNLAESGSAIEFTTPGGVRVLHYGDLHAYDAAGRDLPAHFSLSNASISIWVDDAAAIYPITVDPLATTPNWTAEINQANAQFGFSVSTAGDVNGDGYGDVIVGVPLYDHWATTGGAAFVYLGSAAGLSTVFNWWAEGNQDDAQLGFSVGTAGDINGDGYADVIVGAPLYDNGQTNEGSAFVWFGSAGGMGDTGLPSNADWSAESNQAGAYLGWSVGTAGNVNGDGYDDVIVGANQYTSGLSQGRAFVWLGAADSAGTAHSPNDAHWWAESGSPSQFAWSVGTAGDVNGDGYDDVIVGAPLYSHGQSGEGGAFVWHGSASGLGDNGTPANADWSAEGNQELPGEDNPEFGWSVGAAGDVNGDGYADVIVGAPDYDCDSDGTGEGRAFVYHGSAAGLNTTASWTAEGTQDGAFLGGSVGMAGDVNGDGYADVIVGADWYAHGQVSEGQALVYLGSGSGLSAAADWTAESDQAGARFGVSVSTAGDVNGDGYTDIIVGAFLYDGGQENEGRAYVYHGSATSLKATAGWTAEGNQEGADFGISAGTAGDVNGDGYADVIVGASSYDGGQTDEGRAFVYHGSATGLSAVASWTAESNQAYAGFGESVGTAGDVNGDGYSDVVVGAAGYDNGQSDEGRVYVYHGSATGLSTIANWMAESDQIYTRFGSSVGTAGDVNGDGYADVIVGALLYDNGQADEGRAYVYYGAGTGLSTTANWTAESDQALANFGRSAGTAGDVNGDGYSDVIVGAYHYGSGQQDKGGAFVYYGGATGLSTTAGWVAEGGQDGAFFGWSVGTAGDVNGDGYSDVIVGAPAFDDGQDHSGRVYVYYGSAIGPSAIADWTVGSSQAFAFLGNSVGTAGDVNGDGYADVIIGAHGYSNGQSSEGRAYVHYGSEAGLSTAANWTAESDQFHAYFGTSVGTAGDVNGDGYADVIVGAPGYDSGQPDEGRAFVYYGNGGAGLALTPRQMRIDGSAPVAPLGMSDSATAVQLRLTGRTPLGREKVKLQWQVAPLGVPFTAPAAISGTSAAWTDVLTMGAVIAQDVTGLAQGTAYHWRVRLLYRPGNRLGQNASRWLTVPWNGWMEQDFGTPEPIAGLAAANDGPTPLRRATALTATVTAGNPVAYTWAFGDGSTGHGAVVHHTYPAVGTYTAVVTASNSASLRTATTTVVVQEPVSEQTTWTFILYFAGDNDLYPKMQKAVDEMERVANKPNVEILVLLDGPQSIHTDLYHVQYDTAPGISSPALSVIWNPGELNTGNVQTLVDFVNWARTSYPADYYFLSIADHGRGTSGIAQDIASGGDYLSAYAELESALDAIAAAGGKIDVLFFDACLMGMIEDAYEVRDNVDYIVASENLGWTAFAYDAYVSSVLTDTTPHQLAQNVADAYIADLQVPFYPATVSALDISAIESVGVAADALARTLQTYLEGANISQVITLRDNVQTFDSRDCGVLDSTDEYVDLYHFAELAKVSIGEAAVQNAAQNVIDAIGNCVIAEHHQSGQDPWSKNHWDLDDAHGIAIYFPPQSNGWDYVNYVTGGSWAFCNMTAWDEFLLDYFAISGLPPEMPMDPGMPMMMPTQEYIFLPIVLKNR